MRFEEPYDGYDASGHWAPYRWVLTPWYFRWRGKWRRLRIRWEECAVFSGYDYCSDRELAKRHLETLR